MIEVDSVTKYYRGHAAVADLSFNIAAGEVVGLLGLNGAGKTTTLRMLSAALLPTAGRISIDGVDLSRSTDQVRARIGFLPETPPIYPEMTVHDYLRFVANIKGLRSTTESAIDATLEATDLSEVRDRPIGVLSHGYQRRVGIAQAVVHRPKLILLDEPTSGLDPVQVIQMRKLITSLGENHTVLVSSHILSEIDQLCDRILVLQNGKLVAEGTDSELAEKIGAKTSVRLEIVGERERLESTLGAMDEVTDVTWLESDDDTLVVTVQLRDDARETLAKRLVNAGFGLRGLSRVRVELENIFLQLTGQGNQQPRSHL